MVGPVVWAMLWPDFHTRLLLRGCSPLGCARLELVQFGNGTSILTTADEAVDRSDLTAHLGSHSCRRKRWKHHPHTTPTSRTSQLLPC